MQTVNIPLHQNIVYFLGDGVRSFSNYMVFANIEGF